MKIFNKGLILPPPLTFYLHFEDLQQGFDDDDDDDADADAAADDADDALPVVVAVPRKAQAFAVYIYIYRERETYLILQNHERAFAGYAG